MKSFFLLFPAFSLTIWAFPGKLIRSDVEDDFTCLNNEVYDSTQHPPIQRGLDGAPIRRAATVQIDAYAHVLVAKKLDEPAGQLVKGKFANLNDNFRPWGYHFNLVDFDVQIKPEWTGSVDAAKPSQQTTRQGDYRTLNVYMVEGANSGVCSYPKKKGVTLTQQDVIEDGCFVPWGNSTTASTMTHEVGHWMNLVHVFQGGCAGTDFCDDTFPQADASQARPKIDGDLSSCPVQPQCDGKGKQNVLNFVSQIYIQYERIKRS